MLLLLSLNTDSIFRVDSDIITIIVASGDIEKKFYVHEGVLSSSGRILKASLNESWLEGQTKEIRLSDVAAPVFRIYAHWLYTGLITTSVERTGTSLTLILNELTLAYVLGDRLQDDDFCDAIIDTFVKETEVLIEGSPRFPASNTIALIYKKTMPESKLRRLIIDQHVGYGHAAWLQIPPSDGYNADFLLDLSLALIGQEGRPKPPVAGGIGTCQYHFHNAGGSACYKSRVHK